MNQTRLAVLMLVPIFLAAWLCLGGETPHAIAPEELVMCDFPFESASADEETILVAQNDVVSE